MLFRSLDGVRVEPVREVQRAVEAIEAGRAEMALLVPTINFALTDMR